MEILSELLSHFSYALCALPLSPLFEMSVAPQATEEQIFQSGHAGLACGEESWHEEFKYCEFKQKKKSF